MSNSWDLYFLNVCKTVASNSKCLSRKIGSIIVKDRSIISTGYNGPASGVPPCNERWIKDKYLNKKAYEQRIEIDLDDDILNIKCPRYVLGYKSGQGLDICVAQHSERNAISNAAKNGISTKGSIMYMDCPISCKDCMGSIINAGIVEVVCTELAFYDEETEYLVKESGINVRKYQL